MQTMQTVGDFLKQEREYRNISLREVSHSTKISGFYLDFLEKGDYGKMPGGPYIKGYISSYADCIGIDAEEALKKYESLNAMQKPSDPTLDETPRVIKKQALIASGGRKKMGYLLVAVLLAGCMFGGYHFFFQNKPATDLLSAIVKIPPPVPELPATDGLRHKSEGLEAVRRDPQTAKLNKPVRDITPPLVEQVSDQVVFSAKTTVESRGNPTPVSLTVVDPAGDRPEYAQAQPDTSLELLETAVCANVKDRTPSGAGDSFAWSTARIYTWQLLRCDSPPSWVRHVYYFKGQKVSEVELEIRANLWRTWSYKTLQNEQLVGPWRVDILSADGSLLQRIPFTVY